MVVPRNRFYTVLAGVSCIMLLAGLVHMMDYDTAFQISRIMHNGNEEQADQSDAPLMPAGGKVYQKTWHEIALAAGTDKVTTHEYQYMYEKYLPSIRGRHVKMLEIGLGCNMNYGPGKSYSTWLEYFPDIELFYIEYDAACAEKWAHKTEQAHVFTGDQANATMLEEFIAKAGMDFDLIIDDGGHRMDQQIVSLQHLWKAVKPGGMYILEDLQTSYWKNYGGDSSTTDQSIKTAMKFIYELIDDRMSGTNKHEISETMRSIDCMKEVCGFTKKTMSS
ncbi:unnamed protein product [Parascedosporium putredinis]|uniref:Hard-surface induced protein 5 n=1 Tax=Parascedosporium putredinis TaxID=1442378 RepID=A0A9P1GYW5_9PEZI|nr:unnamed protein product [Parascedosporium putredinis]CAI7991073.1 unnamed protein product [Parascedosporium putredinis]